MTTSPRSQRIYLSPPDVGPAERQALLDAFDSGWIAPLGPDLDAFEREFAERLKIANAVGLSTGTAALHLALIVTGVQPGQEVLVSSMTFAATANAIRYVGATPVFIDSDAPSWHIDPALTVQAIEERVRAGKKPGAVIVVHLYGRVAEMATIIECCRRHAIPVIEDAAEALGADYHGISAGCWGDIGIFSFNGNKIITTSGGGMLVTAKKEWADKVRHLATQARMPAAHYQHEEIGFNYRLSNLLAAFGRAQLAGLDSKIQRRQNVNTYYRRALENLPGITFMPTVPGSTANHWLTCIQVDPVRFGVDRETIRKHLESDNIEARPMWKPMHMQPVFSEFPVIGGAVCETLFELGLCLPSGSGLTTAELDRIVTRFLSSREKR